MLSKHNRGGYEKARSFEKQSDEAVGDLRVGYRSPHLVFPRILPGFQSHYSWAFAKVMAIAEGLLTLVALCGFCLAFACSGNTILRLLRFEMEREGEHLLVTIGVGLVGTEILLFLIQFTQHIRQGGVAIIGLLCVPLFSESRSMLHRVWAVFQVLGSRSTAGLVLLFVTGIVLCVELLTSLAPLTGSDAMHYHFTVQKLILEDGFHPIFSNTHSFLCGQHHLLILLGLALGSEKLALGFIFLGGVLSAAILASLAARWASEHVVLGITLLFLLTPVVFWQMSTSGAPDVYMAFLAGTVLIVLYQSANAGTWRQALVAGLLTGGIAGAKYTGCFIAAAVGLSFIIESRRFSRWLIFMAGSLIGGIWPYLRNTIWTGNPVFPFLSEKLSPHLITAYGLTTLASDTGATANHNPAQFLPFLFFAATRAKNPGLWDFFGPTVFVLAPLVFLAYRNTREWRIPVLVWFLASLGIFFASGLPRFLLPLFPVALLCVAAAIEWSIGKDWKIANAVSVATIALMILAGAAGLAVYCRKPVLAAVGFTSREAYLEDRAPDYQIAQAINQLLGTPKNAGTALIFLRHQYYLHIPYLNADPGTSFEADPERLKTPEQWKEFLKVKAIVYVVRAPSYPMVIAAPLEELEKRGELVRFAQREVGNLKGMRIEQGHITVPVIILKTNF